MDTSSDAATVIAGQHGDALPPGTLIHHYRIIRLLGRGAFGLTYLAEEPQLQRLVAIKEYLPSAAASRDDTLTVSSLTPESEEFFRYGLSSFLQEARTLVQFDHPNVARVLTYFSELGTAYLVMNYETGHNFNEWLRENPHPPETALLDIFLPINRGLSQVHEAGYIHRDIKADNIYIREDGTPVLLDFGAARDIRHRESGDLTRILTPGYAPYEQENPDWHEQGPWTDIYALAATLYYAVCGKRPASGGQRAAAVFGGRDDPYVPLSDLQPDGYSPRFLQAIDQALAFDPNARPSNTTAWNDLFVDPEPEPAVSAPPQTETGRSRAPLFAGLGLLVILAAGGVWWQQQSTAPATTPVATSTPATEPAPQETNAPSETESTSTAPPPEPVKVDQTPMAKTLVVSALLLSKTACWHEAREQKISGLIESIRNLPETADRTQFLVDQQNKLDESRAGFASNSQKYAAAVAELGAVDEETRSTAVSQVLESEEYQRDPVYQTLGQVLLEHTDTAGVGLEVIREDLKQLSRNGLMEQG